MYRTSVPERTFAVKNKCSRDLELPGANKRSPLRHPQLLRSEHVFVRIDSHDANRKAQAMRDLPTPPAHEIPLTDRQAEVLSFVARTVDERGYPPSVREIGTAVGLNSPSTVHAHLETLQRLGYLRKDPSKPRAIEVRWDPVGGSTADRGAVRHVPLLGDVAAGTGVLAAENIEELMPLPANLTGDGDLFMLRVRGESMIDAGIFDGDFVVVRSQATATNGEIIVAGIPGEEATVKTFSMRGNTVTLTAHNPRFEPMTFPADEITIYGKVVTVLRKL